MRRYRPIKRLVIPLPITMIEVILELVGIAFLIAMIALPVIYWAALPEAIPTHFGFTGEPDNWGGKESLIFLPMIGTVLYLVMGLLSRYPHTYNYPVRITEANAEIQYLLARQLINWLKTLLAILFAYIEWGTIQVALGNLPGLGPWTLVCILLIMFVTIIYFVLAFKFKG